MAIALGHLEHVLQILGDYLDLSPGYFEQLLRWQIGSDSLKVLVVHFPSKPGPVFCKVGLET